jgi:hypothetical protein
MKAAKIRKEKNEKLQQRQNHGVNRYQGQIDRFVVKERVGEKTKKMGMRRKRRNGPLTKSKSIDQAQFAIHTHQGPIAKAQSDLGPEESKAQLKWAPAASKDGSDYDPPSPVTYS